MYAFYLPMLAKSRYPLLEVSSVSSSLSSVPYMYPQDCTGVLVVAGGDRQSTVERLSSGVVAVVVRVKYVLQVGMPSSL